MPPKKKIEPQPAPTDKLSGVFGWCLLPQHELCPSEAPSIRCSCACHTQDKVLADEPITKGEQK